MKMVHLTKKEAQGFYAVHKDRPFFDDLTDFMTSGPIVALVLEADGAIAQWRSLMGDTDSAKAAEGTIRAEFGTDKEKNATHGSDAVETAKFEIGYFFNAMELC
jgi:nucleoside-diphosphate kinase